MLIKAQVPENLKNSKNTLSTNQCYTVWYLKKFSISQILREINFGYHESQKKFLKTIS